ncbi:hypothetical protein DL240_00185 [Lujinxingia litoralis]|uniref:Tryptophan-rich sensory protein n=1 Tax=Lujinxingia litoralis TaxID=2211119 RepID=A0A328C974_9DELT|nr:tryptophan-rich sensory protein [Lujinxingia litoralis]RAL24662.1 hypothetical protein DL240_00185 [Lujinxingia litoralis]
MPRSLLKILALIIPPLAISLPQLAAPPGRSVGAISETFFSNVLIIPAGYAFSIWGFIYAGILTLALLQALPRFAERARYQRARLPLIVTMLFNAAWLLSWQSLLFGTSLLVIAAQLASAIWLYQAFATHRGRPDPELRQGWSLARLIRWTLGAYVAWLTIATVLNASALLVSLGWEGWGLDAVTWSVIMLVTAALIGAALRLGLDEPLVALVFIWAFIAVVLAPGQNASIQIVAGALAALFALVAPSTTRRFFVGLSRSERRRSETSASLPTIPET